MTKEWKWVLAIAAVLLTGAGLQAAGDGGTQSAGITDAVRYTTEAPHNLLDLAVDTAASGPVEITLVTDGRVDYESFVLDSPDRLVLDLQGVVSRVRQGRVSVHRSGVARVRAGQHRVEPRPVTRVVIDLEQPLAYAIEKRGSSVVVVFDGQAAAAWDVPAEYRRATTPPSAEPVSVAAVHREESVDGLVAELEARHPGEQAPEARPEPATPAEADTADATEDVWTMAAAGESAEAGRAVEPDLIEQLLRSSGSTGVASEPLYQPSSPSSGNFSTKTIVTAEIQYTGKPVSLNLVDADIKQVFRLFHEISGLNFVLDPSVDGRVTMVLDQVPWDLALDLILQNNSLDKVLDHNVIRIASTQKLAQEAASRKQLKEAKELEVEPITITRTLSYARAKDVERVIRDSGVLSPRGKAIVDDRTNTLIISDIPKKVDPLDALISTLDTQTPQVMIEARIVETSRDFVQDLGVIWGAQARADASTGTSTGLVFPHNASVKYGLNLPGEGGASNLAFRFGNVIDSFTLDVALNTLETEGAGRVLSSPKIATQNNEQAEIEQGVRIPIVNTTATEINVEFVSASLKMVVTPQITAEGTIILAVDVENNSPDFVNTAGGIPSIRTQRAQTKVLINDGGTTVIGGIFTINEGRSEVGVPWFRKLPVFGWLFKSQNITNQNRELLIFISPKIMRLG